MLPNAGSIFVFWVDLDLSFEGVEELRPLLSAEEEHRVARLASPIEQRRSTVRIARRRQVVAELCGVTPNHVVMASHPSGQPFAISPEGDHVHLSSSGCGGLGLIAISPGFPIGVDVEAISELPESERLSSWVASASESRRVAALPPLGQRTAYLRLWTRKEAVLKATGEGIGSGFRHIEVPFNADPWAQSFRPVGGGPRWLLYGLPCPDSGLDAALVVRAPHESAADPEVSVANR